MWSLTHTDMMFHHISFSFLLPICKQVYKSLSYNLWQRATAYSLESDTLQQRGSSGLFCRYKYRVLCFHNAGSAEDMFTSEGTGQRKALSPLLVCNLAMYNRQ